MAFSRSYLKPSGSFLPEHTGTAMPSPFLPPSQVTILFFLQLSDAKQVEEQKPFAAVTSIYFFTAVKVCL